MRWPAVLVGICALAQGAGAKPRAGKVVRVERSARGFTGIPRYCQMQADPLTQASGTCFGAEPAVGDTITVLDTQHVLATLRVSNVAAAMDTTCPDSNWWIVNAVPITGSPSFSGGTGVIDVPLDPRSAHLTEGRSPSNHAPGTDNVATAIDTNGDGYPDVVLVAFPCDESGTPGVSSSPGQCLEWYSMNGHTTERLRRDRIRTCY